MKPSTIEKMQHMRIDVDAPGAAILMAWRRAAQDAWSMRDFSEGVPENFPEYLRKAHEEVRKLRENKRREQIAAADPEIFRLRQERNKMRWHNYGRYSFEDQARVDAQIEARMREIS